MDLRFELNCDGSNIPIGASSGGKVFNEDSLFDYENENFTIKVGGVE
jgi:hypothetical protein